MAAPRTVRLVAAATLASAASLLPMFMLSAQAVLVRRELGFSASELGLLSTVFFGASAFVALFSGRLADRYGSTLTVPVGSAISALALLGVAAGAGSWASLAIMLALAGAGNAIGQIGALHLVASRVDPRRQGWALGLTVAAIPFASLLAGFTVPLVGLTVGWRAAFAAAVVVPLLVVLLVPRERPPARAGLRTTESGRWSPSLALIACGVSLTSATGMALVAFTVEYAAATGFATDAAGLVLSVGSLAAIGTRVVAGWLADRGSSDALGQVNRLMALSAVAFAGLSVGALHPVVVAAVLLGFGTNWGYPGLLSLGVVRLHPDAPAFAVSVVMMGTFFGSMGGPLAFGSLVDHASYQVGWLALAAIALAAADLVALGRRLGRRAADVRA